MKGRGLFVFFAGRVIGGWLVSLPIATLIAGSGIAQFPDGDALLFEPGGAYLLDAVRKILPSLGSALRSSLWLYGLVALASLVPLSALLVALDAERRLSLHEWGARALEQLPRFTLLAGATLLAQGALCAVFVVAWGALRELLSASYDERSADLVSLSVPALGILCVLAFGLFQDVVRAAAVRQRASLGEALRAALSTARARPFAIVAGWLMPLSWSIAALSAGAIAVGRLRLEQPGEWRADAALAIHQLVVLTLVGLRALWLKRALELVGAASES